MKVGYQSFTQFLISLLPHFHFYKKMGTIEGSHRHIGRWWAVNCTIEIRKCVLCGKEQGKSYMEEGWRPMLSDLKHKNL